MNGLPFDKLRANGIRIESAISKSEVTVVSSSFAGKVNAPEFPTDLEWVNTDRPLTMQELAGKIVVLDFWTYC